MNVIAKMEMDNRGTSQKIFDEITDVSDNVGKRHCLSHVLVMSICESFDSKL